MILIQNDRIQNEIPVLNIAMQEKFNEQLATVIFLHGITSSKEQNLSYAYLLAEKGYRTLLPDFPLHGERTTQQSNEELQFQFWDIVLQGIAEVKIIVDHYINLDQVDSARIGVAGTSMGSITMFGALTQYDWVKTAVSLMGTPCYQEFAAFLINTIQREGKQIPFSDEQVKEKVAGLRPFDLSKDPSRLSGRPLLIWHGQNDQVVPYVLTKNFYDSLIENQSINASNIEMITDPQSGHKVTRKACHTTVQWFETKL
ncbi:alpha/beta fold hydrolase [Pseudalkalibacillus decolorationis]|uniref:alpha/beta fold hydrolase n=1 Tax=Pseudalkalibacillus decolorationis TaxID=163879 RepID=UPI0021495FB4|nr:alpha/beta fold hydrolase [Pseudalkalibacillus decolorationis]